MGAIEAVRRAKQFVRRAAAQAYACAPGFLEPLRGKVTILTYHRVVSDTELSHQFVQPGMYVTAHTFDQQVRFLKRHFEVISLQDLLLMWEEQRWDPSQRYCVMTFDDGWLDNYLYAFPVLRRHALPATVFLPTDFIGTDRWFWPDQMAWLYGQFVARGEDERRECLGVLQHRHTWFEGPRRAISSGDLDGLIECCKLFTPEQIAALLSSWADSLHLCFPSARQVINWDEARTMSAGGVSFGAHSVSHAILTRLEPKAVVREVEDSWAVLTLQRVRCVPVFCYPNGDWSADVSRAVQKAGYKAAATTEFGYEGAIPTHRFGLKRVNVHEYVTSTDSLFAFHLAGYNRSAWW
jgi:peptidoglycan/xylan/chitin deacetylase (PgdA/CDA1 family)